jgi:hypothetical protein
MKSFYSALASNIIVIVGFVFLLSGCATTQPTVIYKTIAVLPPDSLLQDCDIVAPPPVATYVAAEPKEREKMLIDHSSKQIKNIGTCNSIKKKEREWKQQQKDLYKSAVKEG